MYRLFLAILLFLSCSKTETNLTDSNLKIGTQSKFWVKIWENKLILSDFKIGFQKVITDSRCAKGAVCVWAGRSDISLWMLKTNSDTVRFNLSIDGYADENSNTHKSIDTMGYKFSLLQLDPYPILNVPTLPSDYSALLEVTKL